MISIVLLIVVTVLYAGYNLFIKVSGDYVPDSATTTVAATICLQLAALATSLIFLVILILRGGHVFVLSTNSYLWSVIAGLCIGGAEIGYFYLFGGVGITKLMPASIVIPVIVGGTIAISLLFSYLVLKETIAWNQWLGCCLIIFGILFLFANGQQSPV